MLKIPVEHLYNWSPQLKETAAHTRSVTLSTACTKKASPLAKDRFETLRLHVACWQDTLSSPTRPFHLSSVSFSSLPLQLFMHCSRCFNTFFLPIKEAPSFPLNASPSIFSSSLLPFIYLSAFFPHSPSPLHCRLSSPADSGYRRADVQLWCTCLLLITAASFLPIPHYIKWDTAVTRHTRMAHS